MVNITVFASGRGSNFLAIADLLQREPHLGRIRLLISDNNQAKALESAREMGIITHVIRRKDYHNPEEYVKALLEALEQVETELILLAGYLKLVPAPVVQRYRYRIMNIHPALLPNFGGKGFYGLRVHQAVIESGVKVTGVTIHFVDERYDQGPIIAQRVVEVRPEDDPESLAHRVLEVEHQLYPEVVKAFCEGRIKIDGRKVWIEHEQD